MKIKPPDVRFFKLIYRLGMGPLVGRMILILTTTGRKTGLPRDTALQYEEVGGKIYLGSSRGSKADWFRNILVDPHVIVRYRCGTFRALAEPVVDPLRIADFLELRLNRHPRMVRAILKSEGLGQSPSREELETYAQKLAIVIVRPVSEVQPTSR